LPPDLAPCLDLPLQVAGFHRAVPSTALDKAGMQFCHILLYHDPFVNSFSMACGKMFIIPLWTFHPVTAKIGAVFQGVELF